MYVYGNGHAYGHRRNGRMMYKNFEELKKHEAPDRDYRIFLQDVGSQVLIMAPHGGKIEPKTSFIARQIAKRDYNCYCFEGIKPENNGNLHITSHRFDEPIALEMVSNGKIVVAIHACKGTEGRVYLGGLDEGLKGHIARELGARGIRTVDPGPRFKGLNPHNICNRGLRKKGVQLEITRDIRDDTEKTDLISQAVRAALETFVV